MLLDEWQRVPEVWDAVRRSVASGFPAIRSLPDRARRAQLDSYLARVVDRDFEEVGQSVCRPDTLRRWMTDYAAAVSTTATLESIRDAATTGTAAYRREDGIGVIPAALLGP